MKISAMLWVLFEAYWIVAARRRLRSSESVTREPALHRAAYLSVIFAGALLLFWRNDAYAFTRRLWPERSAAVAAGLAVQIAGILIAVFARQTLGSNWSGRISIGSSQELIVAGPYRYVRHPIYSGMLLALLGTTLVMGRPAAFVGFAVFAIGILVKTRREEAALRSHFGQAYEAYAARVPGLVPGFGKFLAGSQTG